MSTTPVEGTHRGDEARRRADGPTVAVVAFVVAVCVGGAVRAWQLWGRAPLVWADTADFRAVAGEGWTSPWLWAGIRPPGVPVVLKLLGDDDGRFMDAQAAMAVGCWAVLCASVATVVAGRWPRVVAVGAVLALSLTTPVTMWERSVLSESPGISSLALVVAAGLQVARGVTWSRVALLAAAAVPWLVLRDTHAVVALVGGGLVLGAVVVTVAVDRRRARRAAGADPAAGDGSDASTSAPSAGPASRRGWAILGAVAVGLGVLVLVGASHGERQGFPTRNVYEVRVLPYPDRVRWFADHGMPQADEFVGPDAREPSREPGLPPVVYVPDDDPGLQAWLDWVEDDGRSALARYALTHPGYLVAEPLRVPERAFNNALGDREFYRALDHREVPLVDTLLARRTVEVVLVAGLAVGWAIGRGRVSPALATGACTALLAVPHGLVAWHSDGMETARHLVVPALQFHLGVLLVLVGLLPVPVGGAGDAEAGGVRSRDG